MIAFIDSYRDQFGVELICACGQQSGFLTSQGIGQPGRPASIARSVTNS